jgi:antitoxin component YwqK of YwqJK toxin-antitoxin module
MAIVVGLVTGSAVRYFGRGGTMMFGVAGAVLSLSSCLAGNILSIYGFIAKNNSWNIFQALTQVDFSQVLSGFPETFSPMDFVFYGLAIYEGYRFSVIPAGPGPRAEAALFSSFMRPSLARFRKPLLVAGGVLVLAGIYGLRYLASGQMTLTSESGAKATGELRSGKTHGLWTYYSEKGAVQSKMNFREGELDGEASWWSEDGTLAREGAFWQGQEHGEWKSYDVNGTVLSRGRFAYGRPVGEWEYRHPNNEKSTVCRYKLGALDGDFVSWHPNGTTSEQGSYQDGKKIGVWKTWDSGGLPLCEYRYEGDKEIVVNCWAPDHSQTVRDGNGEFVSCHPNGQVNEKGAVTGGRKTGVWYGYHPNGTLALKARWDGETSLIMDAWNDKGEPLVQNGNGTYASIAETGKTLVRGGYENGLQDGEWTTYYPDTGAVMQVMNYVAGRLEGPSTGYTQSGATTSGLVNGSGITRAARSPAGSFSSRGKKTAPRSSSILKGRRCAKRPIRPVRLSLSAT